MISSLHQRSHINFAGLSLSGPNGNKKFSDGIGSKLGDCKAKASHMGLFPLSQDGGTDKNLTPGSMQNVLTYYVVTSYWAQCVLQLESYRGGNRVIADVLLHSIFTLRTHCGRQYRGLWPVGVGEGSEQEWLNKEELTLFTRQSFVDFVDVVNMQKTQQNPLRPIYTAGMNSDTAMTHLPADFFPLLI